MRLRSLRGFALSSLFALGAAALGVACAADLEGEPEEYKCAYENPPPSCGGTGSGNAGSTGTAGNTSSSGGVSGGSGGSTASGGKTSGGIPPDPACLQAVFNRVSNLCLGCHAGSQAQGDFDLSGSNLGERLSMTPAKYKGVSDPANCKQGALIIDPVNPSESVLLKKVRDEQDCGDSMPMSGKMQANDLACIEDWIMAFGASANVISSEHEGSGTGGSNP